MVKHLISAQVMISWFASSSPALGSVLTAQSLEPASDSVSPSFSAPPHSYSASLPPSLPLSLSLSKINLKNKFFRGTWVAQLVKHLISAQVMISQFVSSSPTSGSVLIAWSMEPALDSVSPSLSVPPPLVFCLSVKNKNKNIKKIKRDVVMSIAA